MSYLSLLILRNHQSKKDIGEKYAI